LRFFALNHRLTRLMLQEFSVSSPRHDWVVRQVGMPVWHRLKPLFEALQSTKRNSRDHPAYAYFSLIGSALIFFGSSPEVRAIGGLNPSDKATVDAFIDYLINMIIGTRLS
jgi:TetR/AcrR family transcriptional regulator